MNIKVSGLLVRLFAIMKLKLRAFRTIAAALTVITAAMVLRVPDAQGKAAAGVKKCQEGTVSFTGYPAGLLYRKLGYESLYKESSPEEGRESDALKEVRELEEMLFPTSPGVDKLVKILNVISGIFTGVKGQDPAEMDNKDIAWLNSLAKPDIPLQWRGKVITYLKSFKEEKRWKNILRGWFAKKELYGPMIRAELKCSGMPVDLEYVAMIESGYNPHARSGAGAVGIWQFMPATGSAYGLVRTTWMDQRSNPELSTISALAFFTDLKARLGSWHLSLASYNAGYGTVLKAMKKFNSNDYWTLSETEGALPWETTNYVPKIIAVAVAGKNPAEFGLDDVEKAEPVRYRVVQVTVPVKLTLVAKAAGATIEEITRLNPELKKNRVPPDVLPYPVRIPESVAITAFEKKFKKLCEGFKPIEKYKVKFGDTLSAIARKSKTTVKEIRELNDIEKSDKLIAGTLLLVPKGFKDETGSAATSEKTVVVVPPKEFKTGGRKRVFYKIIKGDTLTEIVQFFRVKLGDLCLWNNLDTQAVIVPDMVLQIFVDQSFDTTDAVVMKEKDVEVFASGSKEHIEYFLKEKGKKRAVYVAKAGDTLKGIAKKFKVKVSSLQAINNLSSKAKFEGGEKVILYVTTQVYKKHFTKKKQEVTEAASHDKPAGKKEKAVGEDDEASPVGAGIPPPTL